MKPAALTPAMRRELRAIAERGEPSDLDNYHASGALAFNARDKVLGALLRRGLITDGPLFVSYALTDAGRAALRR